VLTPVKGVNRRKYFLGKKRIPRGYPLMVFRIIRVFKRRVLTLFEAPSLL